MYFFIAVGVNWLRVTNFLKEGWIVGCIADDFRTPPGNGYILCQQRIFCKVVFFQAGVSADIRIVIKLGADQILRNANAAYRKWRQEKDLDADDAVEEETPEKETIVNIERLEEQANDGIRKYIKAKNPYEFQDMVAALLRAMGYYTPFIAPKGRNGGVDVIAYIDALGAKTPRIKVQVKHRPDDCIPAKDIRSLLGILRDGDIALFVTSGTYSQQARTEALTSKTYIKLIDGEEFIQMWQDNYSKMTDDDKNMLPLKHIAFVGSSE